MEFIILALIAFAGYKLFRLRRRAIGEAVRAHIYLERLIHGKSVDDANDFADAVLHDTHADIALISIRMAQAAYEQVHNGKILAVVGYAYRRGLRPAMPFWYRIGAHMAPMTRAIEASYGRSRPDTKGANGAQAIENVPNGSGSETGLPDPLYSEADFQKHYKSLLVHLKRRNGPSDTYDRDVQLMVEMYGDKSFREAFANGVMPEALAERFIQKLNKAYP